MEVFYELSETELFEVAGGTGTAGFTFTQSATGSTSASVAGTLTQTVTPVFGTQSGTFVSTAS